MSKNCPKCGSSIPDHASFCTVCGAQIPAQPIPAPQIPAQPTPAPQMQPQPVLPEVSVGYISSTGATGFIDPSERAVCSLKNGYGLNWISGEGWKSEDSVITDKRLYYYGDQGIISKVKTEEIVDLEDITGVSITYMRPWIFIIMAILLTGAGFVCINTMVGIIFLLSAVLFVLLFAILSKSFLRIDYAGGSIRFSVKKYGLNNVRVFQHCIFEQKSKLKPFRGGTLK
ncbi:MAG: zinc-ribbon domain-containing protein [Lachnospiraceae bacterium]|nr:zinc-ribbon domain-containing protein [Lachnospiraceae bacterium]